MAALIKTIAFLLIAIALTAMGLLVPAHVRSVDQSVLELAGDRGPSVAGRMEENLDAAFVGPAQRLLAAVDPDARLERTSRDRIEQIMDHNPVYGITGGPEPHMERFVATLQRTPESDSIGVPVTSLLLPRRDRGTLVDDLRSSSNANIRALLQIRNIRGLVRLNPADHAAGAPYDAGILTLALLIEGGHFNPALAQQIGRMARQAADARPGAVGTMEEFVLATLSLSRLLEYRSLANLAEITETPGEWTRMATHFRIHPDRINPLFTAFRFSGDPAGVDAYLASNPDTGQADLDFALRHGPDALDHLLATGDPLYRPAPVAAALLDFLSPLRPETFTSITLGSHGTGLSLKFAFLLLAGIAFAVAMGAAWRGSLDRDTETLSRTNPMVLTRNLLIALVTVAVLWTFLEPDILRSQDPPDAGESGPRLEFAVADTLQSLKSPVNAMQDLNQVTLLVLVLFFILQLAIYVFCLIKLKEIAKQKLSADMKIRLLENEENLFDFGLYVGLGGTVFALILVAVGVVEASLMAAYASTLFGILFTALFKILHLRPYRRRLIMQAGSNNAPTGELMRNIKL